MRHLTLLAYVPAVIMAAGSCYCYLLNGYPAYDWSQYGIQALATGCILNLHYLADLFD